MNILARSFFFITLFNIQLWISLVQASDRGEGIGHVKELSDKFLDIYKMDVGKGWLVKFYAPWCHHCRQMEPTYNELAIEVAKQNLNIYVARIDCTRYSNVATRFSVRGFPTILYVDTNKIIEFNGDRTLDELLDFAKRLSGPAVRLLTNCNQLNQIKKEHRVFFVHFGLSEPWINYTQAAAALHSSDWFYYGKFTCPNYEPDSVYAFKSSLGTTQASRLPISIQDKTAKHKVRLIDWIKVERFPRFIRVSVGNINQLFASGKLIVVALLSTDPFAKNSKLSLLESLYFEKLESLAAEEQPKNSPFLFAWTAHVELINSIVVSTVRPLPAYVAINTTDFTHYVVQESNAYEHIERILQLIVKAKEDAPKFSGGNGILIRTMRMGYDTYVAIQQMFSSNPILTTILFGLPICLLSFLLYCSCYTDFLEGNDEELEDEEEEEQEETEWPQIGHEDEFEMIESDNNKTESSRNPIKASAHLKSD